MLNMMKFYIILISIRLLYGNFDPDVDICDEPKLDAAFCDDDGKTYILKGKYFWQTRSLESSHGIVGHAKLIADKWSAITDPLTAVFPLADANGQITNIFVMNDKWFAYQKGILKYSDSTNLWPKFADLIKNVTIFSIINTNFVYVLFDSRKKYHMYDFRNFIKPRFIKTAKTSVISNYVWFIEHNPTETDSVMTDLLKFDIVITYMSSLIFISKYNYCKVDLRQDTYEKECNPVNMTIKLLGCPLNLDNRTAMATEPDPHIVKNRTRGKPIIQTQRPSKITEESISETSFGISSEAVAVEQKKIKKRKSSTLWVLIITGILIVVVVVCIIVIAVMINRRKKRKSSKLYIKNDKLKQKGGMGKDDTLFVVDPRTGSLKISKQTKSFKLNSISTKSSVSRK